MKPKIVEKTWGREIVFANNPKYCGKLLVFDCGKHSSLHYHLIKDESWYIQSGKIELHWIDPVNAIKHIEVIGPGEVIHLAPGYPHQVYALEDSVIFEASTQHFDADTYRIEPACSK